MNKFIIFTFFLCLFGCKKSKFSGFATIPKSIKIEQKKIHEFKFSLKRPTIEKRTTTKIVVASSNPQLQIHSFDYRAAGEQLYCCPKAIFYFISMQVEGQMEGSADLIITTEMTVQDTPRQFSDTIHVSILPEIVN